MNVLRQSTVATESIGPVLDANSAEYAGLVIGDLTIVKNGVSSAMAAAATLDYTDNGHYDLVFITGNVDTVGTLQLRVNKATIQMAIARFQVVEEAVYDLYYASGATGGATAANQTTLIDLLEADHYIDTTPTPWQHVLVKKGSGALGVGTELLRQDLKDEAGTDITAINDFVGQGVTP